MYECTSLHTTGEVYFCKWRMIKASVSLLAGGSSAMASRVEARPFSSASLSVCTQMNE